MSFNKPIQAAKDIDGVRRSALWHLGRRDHSEKELREKIARKSNNQDWIERVIGECLANNYLNDSRFLDNFIRASQNRGWGATRIKRDLQRKGIDANNIDDYFTDDQCDYITAAVTLLAGKYRKRIANQSMKQKAMAFLQGKGHSFDDIFKAIEVHNEKYIEEDCDGLNEAITLLFRKFKTAIVERKAQDKALRLLISRGHSFADAADAIKAFNGKINVDI
ncbi:regulatory protein RecX [Psychromonas antarctica]|uniref:regulatory protein RecX n=1 Tax=Psychromonas antarctica TaxID=67573 RepID=UPI001EE96FFD|nr:regulatory protein RecX [Psychromonas antarctica]MCG6200877.1 regulatory protein RecX [Psychromonas antarctica]